jgi:L-fuculose-phosphate aldolase
MNPIGNLEQTLRSQMAACSHTLYRLGYTPGTAGNLSVRLDGERILATPTGCSKNRLKPEDMVIVNYAGELLAGTRNVTSEIDMHLTVYRMRDDVEAVVHAHPPLTTAFASCGVALDQPLCSEILISLGSVPLAGYATTGTRAVSESLLPFLMDHDAIMLANHGAVTYGTCLEDAVGKMETVEHFAQVTLTARQIGTPQFLSAEQVRELAEARRKYVARCRSVNLFSERVS